MPMDYHHQLSLLSDILKNQKDEHFGTNDEYYQMNRLASQLINNENIDPLLKQTLISIEKYSSQQNTQIEDNGVFDNWLTIIDQSNDYT